jgi:hypothetical protein
MFLHGAKGPDTFFNGLLGRPGLGKLVREAYNPHQSLGVPGPRRERRGLRLRADPRDLIRIMPAWESDRHVKQLFRIMSATRCATPIPRTFARGESEWLTPLGGGVEFYQFMRGTLAWTATIACLWPVNGFLMAGAFKVQQGSKSLESLDMDSNEYWTRSFVTALVIGLVTAAFIGLDYVLASPDWADLPAGLVHLVIYLGYVPLIVWILTIFWAMDDLMFGFSMFLLYFYLPIFVLFLLNWLIGFWNPLLNIAGGFLVEVK